MPIEQAIVIGLVALVAFFLGMILEHEILRKRTTLFRIVFRQGRGGRWRFFIVDSMGRTVAISSVQGWITLDEARADAKLLAGARLVLDKGGSK